MLDGPDTDSEIWAWQRVLLVLAVAAAIVSSVAVMSLAFADNLVRPALAITRFDFTDTSGETADRTAEHDARLRAFDVTLRDDLAGSKKIKPTTLNCGANPCTAVDPGVEALAAQAKAADIRYLLVGGIHKMSTLVGWVDFAVLDITGDKLLCNRRLTYRDDTDDSWRRAAKFVARDLEQHCIP
jgi:hypothetical protein